MIQNQLLKTHVNSLELDMLLNAKIKGLVPAEMLKTYDNDPCVKLIYKPEKLSTSLLDLLNHQDVSSLTIKHLIQSILNLEKVLNNHLLTHRKIKFACESIYYLPSDQSFQFIYNPQKEMYSEMDLLYLFRHLFLEQPELFTPKVVPVLHSKVFTLEKLYQIIPESNTLWSKIKFPKFKENPKSISQTVSRPLGTCIIDKNNPTHNFRIYFEMTTIGRGDHNNIQLDDLTVSKSHAIIHLNARECAIEDLNSRNGTRINNHIIHSRTVLKTGDVLHFGDKEFVFIK